MKLAIAIVVLAARVASAQTPGGEFAQGVLETQAPFVDLMTFGAGDMLLERYGHTAICLRYHDPRNQTICFNYGVTNFEAGSSLAWNFLRGTQRFWVEPAPFGTMFSIYQWEDRDVWRQTLPLSDPQARAIEKALWDSIDESKRYYVYDHFFDNCSTRIRDIIDRAVGGKLAAGGDKPFPVTFRDLAIRGVAELPMLVVGLDFAMGRQADDTPTTWEAMFLPDVLRAEVAVKLDAPPELVYRRKGPAFVTTGGTRDRLPFLLFALLFATPLAIVRFAPRERRRRWLDTIAIAWATVPLALVGLLLWAAAIISTIPSVRWNELLFVFVPFDVVLPFLGETRRRRYARVRLAMVVIASLLVAVGVFHQPIWVPVVMAFLPLALLA